MFEAIRGERSRVASFSFYVGFLVQVTPIKIVADLKESVCRH
jgi:hypothetical protein